MGQIILFDQTGKLKKIFYRRFNNILKPAQLKFLYENFVIRCENDEKPLKYYYINSKEIKHLKQKFGFELTPLDSGKESTVNVSLDNFVFLNDKRSAIASLLYHIRNIFVHNRIWLLDSGEIELIDVVPPPHMKRKDLGKLKQKGKQRPKARVTMYAKVSSFSKLQKILEGIIDSQQ